MVTGVTKLSKPQKRDSKRTAQQLAKVACMDVNTTAWSTGPRMSADDSVQVEQEVARIHAGTLLSSQVERRDGHLLRISIWDCADGRWIEEASLEGRGDHLVRLGP